ncbi:hypothetical protein DSO57_1027197 [Entomophthora muscae]|uniref:Uncharacterized protein n=1 Tax=Entomophthora muscae TaxID=34485 RepID=A0ACC2TCT0_9FUNG|nr:hypothetical protein DSO57_1027197 [Entomophthora muscae]
MLLWLIQLLLCFVFAVYQFSSRSSGSPAPPPAVFCPVGVPFGPVHFTEGKFNYLLAYNIYMEPPVTPKLMPASSPDLPTNHTGKLFGIVYITLTGVVDTIIPATGPWSWVGKSLSYLLKLAPILWWALPARNPAQVIPENDRPAARDWIPDTYEDKQTQRLGVVDQIINKTGARVKVINFKRGTIILMTSN